MENNHSMVFVIASSGTRLMPTSRCRARKLLKAGKATIYKYRPFTIQLTRDTSHEVQPIELCMDTGSEHIGASIKSEKHEYVHAQYDNLKDEKLRHESQKMYRRDRRNRKRYRKARFDNRKKPEGWLAPTNKHKIENHISIISKYVDVCPITGIYLEVGQFDPALLQAMEGGGTLQGEDYQKGARFGMTNLREAVFVRDKYTCQICGKTVKDGIILHAHHIVYRSNGGTNRLNNLLTVCDRCHTSKNHAPGGKLYGLKPKTGTYRDATFMNVMRWRLVNTVREMYPDINIHHTYGSFTKASRRELGQLPKSHANDAYAMGLFHPRHRCQEVIFQRRRRNNRCLEKFYDAKYIDSRDGKIKKGAEIGCNRTKRSVSRNNLNNERIFRQEKISKGRRNIRRQRYPIQPGDTIKLKGMRYTAKSTHCKGARVILQETGRSISVKKIEIIKHIGGWAIPSLC